MLRWVTVARKKGGWRCCGCSVNSRWRGQRCRDALPSSTFDEGGRRECTSHSLVALPPAPGAHCCGLTELHLTGRDWREAAPGPKERPGDPSRAPAARWLASPAGGRQSAVGTIHCQIIRLLTLNLHRPRDLLRWDLHAHAPADRGDVRCLSSVRSARAREPDRRREAVRLLPRGHHRSRHLPRP